MQHKMEQERSTLYTQRTADSSGILQERDSTMKMGVHRVYWLFKSAKLIVYTETLALRMLVLT